jgi:hypothetical protein
LAKSTQTCRLRKTLASAPAEWYASPSTGTLSGNFWNQHLLEARSLESGPRRFSPEETSMAMKKTIGAIVASFILLSAGGFLIHSVWLAQDYQQHSELWRTQNAMLHRLPYLYIANLIFSIAAVLIYVRGVEAKPWVGQGIRFGILLALVTVIPNSLVQYFVYPLPYQLVLKWMIGGGLLSIVVGLGIAAICQPKQQSS